MSTNASWELLPTYNEPVPEFANQPRAHESPIYQNFQLCESGAGLMQWYHGQDWMPLEAQRFVEEMFNHFKIPMPCDELIHWSWDNLYYYVEQQDPYMFFFGVSDVVLSEDQYRYQMAVRHTTNEAFEEVDPEDVEVFKYWPKGQEAWRVFMDHPGLEVYFDGIHEYMKDHIANVLNDAHPECYRTELKFHAMYGDKTQDFIHFAIWASLMFMLGPQGRDWRIKHHPIFEMVYEHGECVMCNWTFHTPEYYEKRQRLPRSCAMCGSTEWCVELTKPQGADLLEFRCEKCLHPTPHSKEFTCGKRACSKITCPNHPGADGAKLVLSNRRYGELHKESDGRQYRELPGMMMINHIMIEQSANRISTQLGYELQQLISFTGE